MKQLSGEAANLVLSKLVEENKVSVKEIERIVLDAPSEHMQTCVDVLHDLLCNGFCHWNDEILKDENPWTAPHHSLWLHKVTRFMEDNDIIETQLGHAIGDMNDLIQHYERLVEGGGAKLFDMWREINEN